MVSSLKRSVGDICIVHHEDDRKDSPWKGRVVEIVSLHEADSIDPHYTVKAQDGDIYWFSDDELDDYGNSEEHVAVAEGSKEEISRIIKNAPDMVNSPKHYSVFDGTEAIEVIASSLTVSEFRGYCFGNLLKYRLRVGKKDDVMQELGKADKYEELFNQYKNLCKEDK